METSATNVEKEKERASDIVSSAASNEATGMRRDHESIDDFEHLEPESSPLSETPGKHNFDINPDVKSTVSSGKDIGSSTIVGKAENNQNSSEFSLLGDSKVGSVEAGNTPETLEEIPPAEFSNKLIDFESDEQAKLDSKINVEPEKKLLTSIESTKQAPENLFDLPTQKGSGLDLFNRFEISPRGSDASAMSQAFMEMERGGMREEKNVNVDVLTPEVQNIEPKTDELPKQKTEEKKPAEPEFHPAFAHLKDEAHDDDSFKDTDSIPEQIKAEDKFKDFPEEIQPSKQDFGFPEPNVHGDFHLPAPGTKVSEDISADRREEKNVKEETKTRPGDTVTKQDLELGIPTQVIGKHKLEEKSPIKTKPEVVPPTIKAEAKKTSPKVDDEPVIAPFALTSIGLDAWFKPDRLHPKVVELIYWRDPKKSGIVFGSVLGILLSLTYFSLISVIAYLSLAILTGTISFRVYKTVLQAVQKTTSDGHPFKDILELDLTLPQEKVREMTDLGVAHLNAAACELRRLFLVEDLVDSIKFGVLLWCLTYVGAWFNGMTLIIIAFVALFTLPKVYETNKVQIDQNIDLVRSKIAEISSKIKATIRVGGKKPEEKKE